MYHSKSIKFIDNTRVAILDISSNNNKLDFKYIIAYAKIAPAATFLMNNRTTFIWHIYNSECDVTHVSAHQLNLLFEKNNNLY